jgi:hypothetical protein
MVSKITVVRKRISFIPNIFFFNSVFKGNFVKSLSIPNLYSSVMETDNKMVANIWTFLVLGWTSDWLYWDYETFNKSRWGFRSWLERYFLKPFDCGRILWLISNLNVCSTYVVEFQQVVKLSIDRKNRSLSRIFRRQGVKFEIKYSR